MKILFFYEKTLYNSTDTKSSVSSSKNRDGPRKKGN